MGFVERRQRLLIYYDLLAQHVQQPQGIEAQTNFRGPNKLCTTVVVAGKLEVGLLEGSGLLIHGQIGSTDLVSLYRSDRYKCKMLDRVNLISV